MSLAVKLFLIGLVIVTLASISRVLILFIILYFGGFL